MPNKTKVAIGVAAVALAALLIVMRRRARIPPPEATAIPTLHDLFQMYTDSWTKTLRSIKDTPLPGGAGTIDKLVLNATTGFSVPWGDAIPSWILSLLPFLSPAACSLQIADLRGFASQTTFTTKRIDTLPGNPRKVIVYLDAVAPQLQSWVGFSVRATTGTPTPITFLGSCPKDTVMTFFNVKFTAIVTFTFDSCSLGFGKVQDVAIKMTDVTIGSFDFPCNVQLTAEVILPFKIPLFNIGSLGIGSSMAKAFGDVILPAFVQGFVPAFLGAAKGQVIPCLTFPAPDQGCLTGVSISPKDPFITTGITTVPASTCQDICKSVPSCVAAWMQPKGGGPLGPPGSCILYTKQGPPYINMTGFLWDKATGTVTRRMPETGQPATKEYVLQASDLLNFSQPACAKLCYDMRDNGKDWFTCTSWMHDGKCHLYQNYPDTWQTVQGTACQRSTKTPYTIVAPGYSGSRT